MNEPIIDMHIHLGAPDDPQSGCFWSKEFEKTAAYYAMLLLAKSVFKKIDLTRVIRQLSDAINSAQHVQKGVLLALDQAYGENGALVEGATHLHVPNAYLANLVRQNQRLLWGASVHPYRSDWEEELQFCLENGTVLCKWIPSSQLINPSHVKCIPFYRKLAEHNLPLLCHTGPEYTIPTSDKSFEEFNNPKYLRTALENGVRVILAHCALPYFWLLDVNYADDYDAFLALFAEAEQQRWQLYADVSALCTPLRAPYIDEIQRRLPADKILFGSDYPVPLFEMSYQKSTHFFNWIKIVIQMLFQKNPLDKNYLLMKNMGFDAALFTNAARLFSEIQYP